MNQPSVYIFIGVSGCGKSTVGQAFADSKNIPFLDADDYHSEQAKKMMAAGEALTDGIRAPWIKRLLGAISEHLAKGVDCCLAYSGLKAQHRQQFLSLHANVYFFHLVVDFAEVERRVNTRRNHFFSPALVKNQFDSLEAPLANEHIHSLNACLPVNTLLRRIFDLLP